jgi:general secretion pathway protein J
MGTSRTSTHFRSLYKPCSIDSDGGFTLLEMLVSISILALLTIFCWHVMDVILRTQGALNRQIEQTSDMRLAFGQMEYDLSRIADNRLLKDRIPFVIAPDRLVLVRKVSDDNLSTNLQVVQYQISDGNLVRRESRSTRDLNDLLAMQLGLIADANHEGAVIMLHDVDRMKVREWVNGGIGWLEAGAPRPSSSLLAGNFSTTGLEVRFHLPQKADSDISKIFILGGR